MTATDAYVGCVLCWSPYLAESADCPICGTRRKPILIDPMPRAER